ncbi:MAG: NAD-dependent epimerase/dehydratase family protein [Oricola sp.]|jgi:UDP-glucuronate 4-epimerase|nr:NAD-dependent epimerase/dehydratase family protein [Oricola sp.]
MAILVTGAAGFIGASVSRALMARGEEVVGLDNLNSYYPISLKRARLSFLLREPGFRFVEGDITDGAMLHAEFASESVSGVIHLAAQAGVRYSIENPFSYNSANLTGHLSILEFVRRRNDNIHLVYASSSSVYGANSKTPFSETDRVDSPVSFYGATKKSNEIMSESYARLYGIRQTGLRFFTVYGPWGRPDMAYWTFTEKMLRGEPIQIFNHGNMGRDFTYIDDIVSGVIAAFDNPPKESSCPHEIYNLGNDKPEALMTMISILESELGVTAKKEFKGMQSGDVERTWADITKARTVLGFSPTVSLADGLSEFVAWRKSLPQQYQ